MTKYIITFLIIAVSMVSCSKEDQTKSVEYLVIGLKKPFTIVMLDDEGSSITQDITPDSTINNWTYSKIYDMTRGEAVYLYIKTTENIDEVPRFFNAGIRIDNKYQYQRKGSDNIDNNNFYEVKMSGIVPL